MNTPAPRPAAPSPRCYAQFLVLWIAPAMAMFWLSSLAGRLAFGPAPAWVLMVWPSLTGLSAGLRFGDILKPDRNTARYFVITALGNGVICFLALALATRR